MKKKTQTVTETTTLLCLKIKPKETGRDWCPECAAEVVWLTPSAAIELSGISELPKECMVHTNGNRICLRSLLGKGE